MSSQVSGIRYSRDQDDIWARDTVEVIDKWLFETNEKFFLDTGDVDQVIIGGKHLQDVYGWVVPDESATDFEKAYLAEEDKKDDSFGEEWYRSITWKDNKGIAVPIIN